MFSKVYRLNIAFVNELDVNSSIVGHDAVLRLLGVFHDFLYGVIVGQVIVDLFIDPRVVYLKKALF